MNLIKNLKVGSRLFAAFGLLLALLGVVGVIGIMNMSKINDMADAMYLNEVQGMSHIKDANINLVYIGRARGNYLLATSEEERRQTKEGIERFMKDFDTYLEKAKPLFFSDEAKRLFNVIAQEGKSYENAMQKVLSLAANEPLAQRSEELNQALAVVARHAKVIDDAMTELGDQKERRAAQASEDTTVLYERSVVLMLVVIGVSVFIGVLMGTIISRSITRPLTQAVKLAETVAAGDLTSRVEVEGKDETAQLLKALAGMNESLVKIVTEVRQASDSIATGSTEIATGNADLSQRTEEQASNLEETAASMEELTATVNQNAETARQASQLAQGASSAAAHGGEVVGQVVTTMDEITTSSKKIADIISVIDGIAFQTNILALNAAVEAARAGEQGRGFAVVAGEVRSLAQKSASAAKEIKDLITASVEKVEAGSALVGQAGESVSNIVTQVKRVNDLISEITAASNEQATGISQVGEAVQQLDQVTQQNAALVEESAAAADSLQQQAARLTQVVGVFKLAQDGGQHVPVGVPQTIKKPAPSRAKAVLHTAAAAAKRLEPKGKLPATVQLAHAAAGGVPSVVSGAKARDGDWDSF
ncbi:methyl-accepting chemotaxis protein [Hydrogenophaga aquatica]